MVVCGSPPELGGILGSQMTLCELKVWWDSSGPGLLQGGPKARHINSRQLER